MSLATILVAHGRVSLLVFESAPPRINDFHIDVSVVEALAVLDRVEVVALVLNRAAFSWMLSCGRAPGHVLHTFDFERQPHTLEKVLEITTRLYAMSEVEEWMKWVNWTDSCIVERDELLL